MKSDIVARLTSRKFLLALFGILTVFFKDQINLTPEQMESVVTLIIAFTAAEGIADAVTRYTNIPQVDEQKRTAKGKA